MFPCLSQFLETACIPWLVDPSMFKTSTLPSLNLSLSLERLLALSLTVLPPSYEDPYDCIEPTWTIENNVSMSTSLGDHYLSTTNTKKKV